MKSARHAITIAAVAVLGCTANVNRAPVPARPLDQRTLSPGSPDEVGMRSNLNATLDSIMTAGIGGGAATGCTKAVGP